MGEARRKGREVEVSAGFRGDALGRRRVCVVVFGPADGPTLGEDDALGRRGEGTRSDEARGGCNGRRNGGEWVTMVVPVVI